MSLNYKKAHSGDFGSTMHPNLCGSRNSPARLPKMKMRAENGSWATHVFRGQEGKLGGILEGGVVFSSTLCPLRVCVHVHMCKHC